MKRTGAYLDTADPVCISGLPTMCLAIATMQCSLVCSHLKLHFEFAVEFIIFIFQ